MKHMLIVLGTRPEAIKMMPLIKALRTTDKVRTTFAVTGQHREMLDQVFTAFEEWPDVDLNLMAPNQSLSDITANVIISMSKVLGTLRPDVVLVHGDTTTAMATAMAGYYAKCRIGHVEAGLRTYDLQHPWPEEFNRVIIDSVADYLFAPTVSARDNLAREYNGRGQVLVTGNTGIDSLLYISNLIENNDQLKKTLTARYDFLDSSRHLILVTGHRRESFGEGFQRICDGIVQISQRPDVQVLYPVHLNPIVRSVVYERLKDNSSIFLCDPVEYIDMVFLMKRAKIILTDSGGIQEEGPALGRPVLVMRDVTERPEALSTGVVKLIGTDPMRMRREVDALLDDTTYYRSCARPVFPYGDGTAASIIVRFLTEGLSI